MEISEHTSIFRGFKHGHEAISEDGWAYKPTQAEIERNDKNNLKFAERAKNEGFNYGTKAVACYYAINNDDKGITHEVMEFKPKHKLIILDMSVWQNLKNIADDCGEGSELAEEYGDNEDDGYSVLGYSHAFYKDNPKKKLKRQSSGIDGQMTEFMIKWMKLPTSPEMEGFGHSMMPGFHSELICASREKSLELVNVYSTTDHFSHELVNEKTKTDVIHMDDLEFMSDGKKNPIKIKDLLPDETREEWLARRRNFGRKP